MAARLLMFLCLGLFFWFPSLELAGLVRVKPKHPRWGILLRIPGPLLVLLFGAFPLALAMEAGPAILLGRSEQVTAVGVGITCLAITTVFMWRNLRAPQIDHEKFKRLQKAKRWRSLAVNFGAVLAILGCGALAWLWGRHTGMRALDKAATQAQAILSERQKGASAAAADQYEKLFAELAADKELQAIPVTRKDQLPQWPEGEELSRLVNARREVLARIEQLTAGPAPAFEISLRKGSVNLVNFWRTHLDFRSAGRLLDLAAREAAARGDGARILEVFRTRLRLGAHAEVLPTSLGRVLARVASCPGYSTMGKVLPAVTAAQASELASHAHALGAKRQAVPDQAARVAIEDIAGAILWEQTMVLHPEGVDAEYQPYAKVQSWFFAPLYGQEISAMLLSRVERTARTASLSFKDARADVRAANALPEPHPRFLRIALMDCYLLLGRHPLLVRADAEQRLAALQTVCALRLYAIEHDKYPETLAELAPRYLAPDVLDPKGPVRLSYKPEGPGCRLTWRSWKTDWNDIAPIGDETEIAIGVPPTPPEKLKKR